MYVTSRPRPRNVAAHSWPHSSLTSTRTQCAPSSARRVKMTRLIPPAAPVTIATLPVKSAPTNSLLPVFALLSRVERIAQGQQMLRCDPILRATHLPEHHARRAAVVRVPVTGFVLAYQRLALGKALHSERPRIQHARVAIDDPLGEDAADGRSSLEAAAAVTREHEQAVDAWMSIDDRFAIFCECDGAGPAAAHG